MRWLITVRKSADLDRVEEILRKFGAEHEKDNPPVPLGETEIMLYASGPASLPEALRGDSDVIGVYPDSEVELY